MPTITQLDNGLHCIDLEFQGQPGVIASYLLEDAGERAIIEIGPTSTLDSLSAALETLHVQPESISKILVTHIHLDHAGASGTFLERFPQARLYVHEKGADHMIDPSRLVASASRIYGDMMDTLWGEVRPVPADLLTVLTDNDTVTVGNRTLQVLYTPGHASHHVSFNDVERESVFTGDVTAVRLQDIPYVRPATPPPDVDLDLWAASLDRLRQAHPRVLYLTHFGPSADVSWHLREAWEHLVEWGQIIREAVERGLERSEIVEAIGRHGEAELLEATREPSAPLRYDLAAPHGMSVDGYLRYFRKRAQTAASA